MTGLKEVRTRIRSVESTKQITSAMKMVSASKLRKAQNAILKLRPYEAKLQELMNQILEKSGDIPELAYNDIRPLKKVLVIAITSNKGLCGINNTIVIKKTESNIEKKYPDLHKNNNVDIITIGKKATDYFKKKDYPVLKNYDDIYQNLTYEAVEPIAIILMESFKNGTYDQIEINYNRFKNAASQTICCENFLPIVVAKKPTTAEDIKSEINDEIDYLYEPSKTTIIEELIPKIIKMRFYKALLEAHASEHGARMTAMHKATDNATELLKDLKLHYNKVRQATITKEIMEIVSGAEALKR